MSDNDKCFEHLKYENHCEEKNENSYDESVKDTRPVLNEQFGIDAKTGKKEDIWRKKQLNCLLKDGDDQNIIQ